MTKLFDSFEEKKSKICHIILLSNNMEVRRWKKEEKQKKIFLIRVLETITPKGVRSNQFSFAFTPQANFPAHNLNFH